MQQELDLTIAETDWIRNHPVVRVYADEDFPPLMYQDANGDFWGISYEYVELLFRKLGIQFQLVVGISIDDAVEMIHRGEGVDLIPFVEKTEFRRERMYFSNVYLSYPIVLLTRNERSYKSFLFDMGKSSIALEASSSFIGPLERDYPGMRLLITKNTNEALWLLATGQADGYIGNLATSSFLIEHNGYVNLQVTSATPYGNTEFSMGVRSDWPELVSIIDKWLGGLDSSQHHLLQEKYIRETSHISIEWQWLFVSIIVVMALLIPAFLSVLLKNRSLLRTRRRLKAEIEALRGENDELKSSALLKGEIFSNISREFRVPVDAIIRYSDLLHRSGLSKQQGDYLQGISESGMFLMYLIDDIITLARIESERYFPNNRYVDVRSIFHSLSIIFSIRAQDKGLDFHVSIDPSVPKKLLLDSGILRQICANIIGNAVKFTEKGKVHVSCRFIPSEQSREGLLEIRVRDTGIGMDVSLRERLFPSLSEAPSQGQAAEFQGFGLVIVKKLLQVIDGAISVESSPGSGSEFIVLVRTSSYQDYLYTAHPSPLLREGPSVFDDAREFLEEPESE